MVSDTIISDSIHTCKKKGMGVAAVTSMDNVMMTDDGVTGRISISRYAFRRIQTPQTYFLGELKRHMRRRWKKASSMKMTPTISFQDLEEMFIFQKALTRT